MKENTKGYNDERSIAEVQIEIYPSMMENKGLIDYHWGLQIKIFSLACVHVFVRHMFSGIVYPQYFKTFEWPVKKLAWCNVLINK